MNRIKRFVSQLLKDLFNDEDKKELIEILTTSLEEKVDDLVEQGTPVDEAIDKSINEFGDAKDVLEAFPDKASLKTGIIRKRRNQLLFATFGYLLIGGLAIFLNLTFINFLDGFKWFVIVLIGVFFWPLSMLYLYLMAKK